MAERLHCEVLMIHVVKTSEKLLQQDSIVEAAFMIAGPAPTNKTRGDTTVFSFWI